LNETLHHFPRRFSKRIIASMAFSHSLDPIRTWTVGLKSLRWSINWLVPILSACSQ
jgi:hypothetical protein